MEYFEKPPKGQVFKLNPVKHLQRFRLNQALNFNSSQEINTSLTGVFL